MSASLNQEIIDAGSLVGLLLVFVFAYFAALFPIFEDIRHRPCPPANDDKQALMSRLKTYWLIGVSLQILVVLVLALLTPLSWQVLHVEKFTPFQTVRIALLLVDLLLIATGIVIGLEVFLLIRRRRELGFM